MTIGISILVEIDHDGTAWITGTNTRVAEIVLDKLSYSLSPEEIHLQYPYLSLAQIYSALTFYYENRMSVDEEIKELRAQRQEMGIAPYELSNFALRQVLLDLRRYR